MKNHFLMKYIMKNSNGVIKKISINIIILSMFFVPVLMFAQNTTPLPNTAININIPNPLHCASGQDCNTLPGLLVAILNNIVMPVAAVAVVIWIVYAGFMYVMAQGNSTKIEKAHQQLLWSLVGAGILLGAAGISIVVQNTVAALIRP